MKLELRLNGTINRIKATLRGSIQTATLAQVGKFQLDFSLGLLNGDLSWLDNVHKQQYPRFKYVKAL